jgi:glycosyltransferase involved in cell wall biosynthesis
MSDHVVAHVLSSVLPRSTIFDSLITRAARHAPDGWSVRRCIRPDPAARVYHFHRPNLEFRLPRRSVATVHHDLDDRHFWLRRSAFLPRYAEADTVICLNRQQESILRGCGITQLEVVPHGVDRGVFPIPTQTRRWSGRTMTLGFVSRRFPRGVKGEPLLARMLAHLDGSRIRFLFVGEGRGQEMALARAHGFQAEVYEYLPYPLFGQAYARMDALLVLSDFEGGPACVPEALGSGAPVFATPVGMCIDLIRDDENGLLLTRDARQDAARIMALLDQDGRGLRRLHEGAFRSAAKTPDWATVFGQQFEIYARVADA